MAFGDVKCAWCGKYIKNTANGGIMDAAGLGLISGIAGSAGKHYCSKACKVAAQQAGGGSKGGGGGGGDGGAAAIKAQAEADNDAAWHARRAADDARDAEKEKAFFESVNGMRFIGAAEEISGELSTLVSLYAQTDDSSSDEDKRKAIIAKMEFGILRLQQSDPAQSAFFQKKLDDINTEAKVKAEKKELKEKKEKVIGAWKGIATGLGFILPLGLKILHILPWSWLITIPLSIIVLPLVCRGIAGLIAKIILKSKRKTV